MMSKKVKNILRPICIILILLAIILLGKFAWSRYMRSLNGTATADIANFSVKVNGQTNEEFELNFAETMNSNASVSSGYVAPGTSGAFTLEVDATESDVSVEYYLSIDTSNKPTNLLLYSDSQHTTLMDLPVSNKIILIDSILVSDSTKTKSTTIYWDWQYETGSTQALIDANDEIDSKYIGKEVVMPVQVKAVQKNGSGPNTYFNKSFADMVHVGDVVNYNPADLQDGTSIEAEGTYTATMDNTGDRTENQMFNVSEDNIVTWQVLGINENGEVELMGITPKTLHLLGVAGYNNGVNEINNIAKIYGYGKGAAGVRSMVLEDVDKYTCHDKNKYVNILGHAYGDTKEYTFNNSEKYKGLEDGEIYIIEDVNGNLIKDTNGNYQLTKGSVANVQQTYYQYMILDYKKAGIMDKVYSMLTADDYWLASYCCVLDEEACDLGIRCVYNGTLEGYSLMYSNGRIMNKRRAVAPVVSLKCDIQAVETFQGSGVWELVLD